MGDYTTQGDRQQNPNETYWWKEPKVITTRKIFRENKDQME